MGSRQPNSLEVALGESLHPDQRALTAEDREDGHQQHPPLGEANAAPHPAIRQRLEEADEIACKAGVVAGWEANVQVRFSRTQRRRDASARTTVTDF